MWKGIDVSDNQGTIDWPQVKAAGVEFAILRSVRRSGKADGQFAANLAGCREHGIPVSVYKYTYAASPGAAALEARQVVDLLRASGMTGTTVWWDVEDRTVLRPLGSALLTACIKAAQDVVEAAGYKFGLYTGFYVYNERWFDFGAFTAVPLWVARYYAGYNAMDFTAMPREDKEPDVGRDLWGWQYTSTGRVPGINGNVDLDMCYVDPAGEIPPVEEYYPLPHIGAVFEVCGIPYSYQDRKKIAIANGLLNYAGTVEENMFLIGLLAQGKLKKA